MAYANNTPSQIPLQDVGIKISQPGIDARKASSNQLIFDSSWPSMAVLFQRQIPITTDGTVYKVAHNLNFPPFVKVWTLDSNNYPTQNQFYFNASFAVDSNYVYINNVTYPTTTLNVYIECYNVNLSVDVDYPSLPTVTYKGFYDNNYGIKIAKNNKLITSTNPRDFVLHSRYRSPLVKAVKTEATLNSANIIGTQSVVQYTNQDGIPTWNYGFLHVKSYNTYFPTGSYLYAPYYAQSYPVTNTDGITTYIKYINNTSTSPDYGATLVILRDPLIATTIVGASY